MSKPVYFKPQNFGGYTFFMLMAGMALGYSTYKSWWWIIISIVMFFIGMYFYAEDNK